MDAVGRDQAGRLPQVALRHRGRPVIRAVALAARRCSCRPRRSPRTAAGHGRLDPEGPVTVGTPLAVTATVLVPTWMPEPPAWPDLQIADAITRLPERATRPVTERIGRRAGPASPAPGRSSRSAPPTTTSASRRSPSPTPIPATSQPVAGDRSTSRHRLRRHRPARRRGHRPLPRRDRAHRHRRRSTASPTPRSPATPSP